MTTSDYNCGKCGVHMGATSILNHVGDEVAVGLYCPRCCNGQNIYLPDTGARTEFSTGAVRDAMEGKGLPSMIPPCAIRAMAKRFEDGAKKYGNLNFQKGIPLSRFYDSIFRHLMSWSEGDTTENHGGAVLWNMAVAMWTQEQINAGKLPKDLNDLPYKTA